MCMRRAPIFIMKINKFKIHLGLLFIIAVILPSFLLSGIAIRTIAREEAFLEKRLEESLQAETNHVAAVIRTELNQILLELDNVSLRVQSQDSPATQASLFKKQTKLAQIPFFISSQREILWPSSRHIKSYAEHFFLEWVTDFFMDRETTPVYQNIALAYKDKILEDAPDLNTLEHNNEKDNTRQQSRNKTNAFSKFSRGQQQLAKNIGDQYAPAYLSQNEPIRQQVYQTAKQSGQQVMKRQVSPSKSISFKQSLITEEQTDSMFIADQLNFSEVIKDSPNGLIPFIVKEKLNLLFWRKNPDRSIVGCLLDQDIVISRFIKILPPIYSDVRILTVLDENVKPIIKADTNKTRDWKRPFVAAEISELLPRWEVVALLTEPDQISLKAQTTGLYLWILIFILLFSIIGGGSMVLRSLNSEIRLAQQKTTFAANVSHELKTPLTSIRMFTEMLLDRRQPDEKKQQQYLRIMLSETERLTRLINNVLDFSSTGKRKKTYQLKEINIVELCRSILDAQQMRLEFHGFEVTFSSVADDIRTQGDEEALKQVVLNLLSNAEKYSDEIKNIVISITTKDQFVCINIKDRGIGIAHQHARLIFDEFYRVDDSLTTKKRGTGLGLTIAQRIVGQHNGQIIYMPHQGGGSVFQIQLPIIREE